MLPSSRSVLVAAGKQLLKSSWKLFTGVGWTKKRTGTAYNHSNHHWGPGLRLLSLHGTTATGKCWWFPMCMVHTVILEKFIHLVHQFSHACKFFKHFRSLHHPRAWQCPYFQFPTATWRLLSPALWCLACPPGCVDKKEIELEIPGRLDCYCSLWRSP